MIAASVRPIDRFPREETTRRRRAPFRTGWGKTLDLLEVELRRLKAKDIVIQADFRAEDIRNDGWPRSSARAGSLREHWGGQRA